MRQAQPGEVRVLLVEQAVGGEMEDPGRAHDRAGLDVLLAGLGPQEDHGLVRSKQPEDATHLVARRGQRRWLDEAGQRDPRSVLRGGNAGRGASGIGRSGAGALLAAGWALRRIAEADEELAGRG